MQQALISHTLAGGAYEHGRRGAGCLQALGVGDTRL